MTEIRKVAVFGAGVMGAGIAAHVANAGVPVRLFDIAASGANRNAAAEGAVARMLKADPAPFMHPRNAELVFPASIDDEIGLVSDCDWIIEAIVENPEAKRALYAKIDAVRKPGSILSSNTSTIRLAALTEGLPASLARDFLITHFFNPPRYQRLVEIVRGPHTRADAVDAVTRFADHRLGKTPIPCKDEPGFIANRIGIYWLQCAVLSAIDRGLTVEAADATLSAPFGIPKTGVFGLLDMVGIDIVPHVLSSMTALLPPDDPFHAVARKPELVERMIASGLTGRKGKGGFYRLKVEGDAKVKQAMDLATGDYRDAHPSRGKNDRGNPRAMLGRDDAAGRYAWEVMSRTLAYAAAVAPAVADDLAAVDDAMRLGYGWRWGPFELIDRIGPDWFIDRLVADGKSRAAAAGEGARPHVLSRGRRPAPLHDLCRRRSRRAAPARRSPAVGREASLEAGRPQSLREPVGHRRRRPLPRVSQQDERARSALARHGPQGPEAHAATAIAPSSSTMRAASSRSAPTSRFSSSP